MTPFIDPLELSQNHRRGYRASAMSELPTESQAIEPQEERIFRLSRVVTVLYLVVVTLMLAAIVWTQWGAR